MAGAARSVRTWFGSNPEESSAERVLVRVLVPLAFLASGALAYEIAKHTEEAPGIAFHNRLLYGGLLFLVVFYGSLLLVLPMVRAIFAGELPVELTTRGPRFADKQLAKSKYAAEALGEQIASVEEELKKSIEETAGKARKGISAVREEAERENQRLEERMNRVSKIRHWRI